MGDDDDGDCVEHVWVLDELHLTLDQAALTQRCARCGAIAYDDLQEQARPPL